MSADRDGKEKLMEQTVKVAVSRNGTGGIMTHDPIFDAEFMARVELENKIGNMRLDLKKERDKYAIDKIIFNPPATVVIWKDGEKTIVKCGEDEVFDHEIGVAMCYMKRIFGSRSAFKRTVKEYLPKPKEEPKREAMSFEEWARKMAAANSVANEAIRRILHGGESCSEK